jgi:hypothetical protein
MNEEIICHEVSEVTKGELSMCMIGQYQKRMKPAWEFIELGEGLWESNFAQSP